MFGGVQTAAQLMVKVGADVQEAQSKLRGVSSSLQNIGGAAMRAGGMMTLGVTGPLAAAGAVITSFASDLEESANKVGVVFGDQATAIQAWAETSAAAFGMSKQQALEAAGTFGNLFTAMGVAGDESANMSQSLIELAADLASFNNIDPTEALEKLRAGLVGEAEPLRTLGVQLSAAAVEARALEMGLAATAKELTEADKVTARYALIMEQTATAQGDFARTSDGLANQMRTVKAQFADAGAQLGTVLIPYVTQFVGWISQLIGYFTNLDPEMQRWIVAIGAVAAAIGPAITIIGALATGIGALLSPIGLVVAAIVALVAVIVDHFGGIGPTIEAVKAAVQNALAGLAAFVGTNGGEIKAFFAATWEQISGIVSTAVQIIQAIVVPIFTGIAAFLAEHGEAIKTVLSAAWQAVQIYIQTALTIIQGILSAALAVLKGDWTGAWEIIKTTTQTVLSNLRTLFETVMRALLTVGQTILGQLRQAFVDRWNEIIGYLRGINLADVGRAIMQGLVDGIRSMAGALVSAAQGVVQSAIDAARNLLGIHSPSRVFMRIGEDTMRGFVDGVLSMAAAVAAAVEGALDEGVQAAIESLAELADALGRIMAAMQALAGYGGVSNLQARMQGLAADIRLVVAELQSLLLMRGDGLAGTVATMDPLATIFERLGAVVNALEAIGDLRISAANITLFVENMRTLVPMIVNALIDVAKQIALDGLPAALAFSQAASGVLGVIGDAVDAFNAMKDYDKDFSLVEAGMAKLKAQIANMVAWLMQAAEDFDTDGLPAAQAFSQAASAVMGVISAAVAAFVKMKEYDQEFSLIDAGMAKLKAQIVNLVQWLIDVAGGLRQEGMPAARLFAEAAGLVTKLLGQALDVLAKLREYVGPTEDRMKAFMWDVQFLLERMVRWITLVIAPLAEDLGAEMMAALSGMVTAAGEALELLTGLLDYAAVGEAAITAFMGDLDELVRQFVRWAMGSRSGPIMLLDVPPELMAIFAAAMSALETAIGTLTALVDYVSPGEAAIGAFMDDLDELVRQFVWWAIGTRSGPINLLEVPRELLETFVLAMEGIGAAVDVLAGLVNYVSPGEAAISAFMGDMESVFRRFAHWASTQFGDVALDVVAAVGDAVGAVFSGLGAAVETLQNLTWYIGPTANSIDRFMDDMEQVMIRLRNWAQVEFTVASMAFLQAFGEMAGTVFSALGQALDLMSGIANYTVSGSQFDLALQRFNDNLFTMITSWRTWILTIMEPETLALVASFASVMGAIVTGMRDALNLLMDIENANLPTADELQAFLDAVALLFNAVLDTFQIVTDEINLMVQRMAMSIAAVLAMLQGVFTDFGVNMQDILQTMFGDLGALMWNRGDYVAGMFMSGLLRGMQNVNAQNAVLNAMNQLALDLKDVLMAAWGISSPSKVAEGIGKNFVAGLAVGLRDLQGIPGMIEDAVGLSMTNNVRLEPAPQRAYLTVSFQGAYQSGMTADEEARISRAMVMELRRQGVALVTR